MVRGIHAAMTMRVDYEASATSDVGTSMYLAVMTPRYGSTRSTIAPMNTAVICMAEVVCVISRIALDRTPMH